VSFNESMERPLEKRGGGPGFDGDTAVAGAPIEVLAHRLGDRDRVGHEEIVAADRSEIVQPHEADEAEEAERGVGPWNQQGPGKDAARDKLLALFRGNRCRCWNRRKLGRTWRPLLVARLISRRGVFDHRARTYHGPLIVGGIVVILWQWRRGQMEELRHSRHVLRFSRPRTGRSVVRFRRRYFRVRGGLA